MKKKITPISFQAIPNSSSVLAIIHENEKVNVITLSKEDIASLREDIIAYYKRRGRIEPDYQPNAVKGIKPKLKPIPKGKTISISAELYKQFQHLYNENLHLKRDNKRALLEIHRLEKLLNYR